MAKARVYSLGDRVRFSFGPQMVEGTVIEDRGPIGVKGRNLYSIRFGFDPQSEEMIVELPAEEMEPVTNQASSARRG